MSIVETSSMMDKVNSDEVKTSDMSSLLPSPSLLASLPSTSFRLKFPSSIEITSFDVTLHPPINRTFNPNRHLLFQQDFWRLVLSCIHHIDAIDLDMRFGGYEFGWLIRKNYTQEINSWDWILAVKYNSLGLCLYLQQYRIDCENLHDLVTFCVENNRIAMLAFFTSGMFKFYDARGRVKELLHLPKLDAAFELGHKDMIKYCLKIWKGDLLSDRTSVLFNVIKSQDLELISLLIPSVIRVFDIECLYPIIQAGDQQVLEYCLNHLDLSRYPHLPEEVMQQAIKSKFQHLVLFIHHHRAWTRTLFSQFNYDGAFDNGDVSMMELLVKLNREMTDDESKNDELKHGDLQNNQLWPSDKSILSAIERGDLKLLHSTLSKSIDIKLSDSAMTCAIKSKKYPMIQFIRTYLPNYKFTENDLQIALHTCDTNTILKVFEYGEFTDLKDEWINFMVDRGLDVLLRQFAMIEQFKPRIYNEKTLKKAIQSCHANIVKDVFEVGECYDIPRIVIWEVSRMAISVMLNVEERQDIVKYLLQVNRVMQEREDAKKTEEESKEVNRIVGDIKNSKANKNYDVKGIGDNDEDKANQTSEEENDEERKIVDAYNRLQESKRRKLV